MTVKSSRLSEGVDVLVKASQEKANITRCDHELTLSSKRVVSEPNRASSDELYTWNPQAGGSTGLNLEDVFDDLEVHLFNRLARIDHRPTF